MATCWTDNNNKKEEFYMNNETMTIQSCDTPTQNSQT